MALDNENAIKLRSYLTRAENYYRQKDYKTGLNFDEKALEIAESFQLADLIPFLKERVLKVCFTLGYQSNYDERNEANILNAVGYYNKALKYAVELKLLKQQMYLYDVLGGIKYHFRDLSESINYRIKAYSIAKEINDEKFIPNVRLSLGTSYVQVGKLKEGILTISPNLEKNINIDNPKLIFTSIMQWIEIAEQIPVNYNAIKKTEEQAVEFLKSNGKNQWKHEIYIHKVRGEVLRGNFEYAYNLGKEALQLKILNRKDGEGDSGQVYDFHYYHLIGNALQLGHIDAAHDFINEWLVEKDQMPKNRIVRMNKCKADIAYSEGNFSDSYLYAKKAVEVAHIDTDYEETVYSSLYSLLRVLLKLKKIEELKETFKKLFKYRFSERFYINLNLIILLGDYAMLLAKNNEKYYKNAMLMYIRAKNIANNVDELLHTSYWSEIVENKIIELKQNMDEKNITYRF